jgi:hypothetical protein
MKFEWDFTKAEHNLKKHGISFDEAVTVFYDPLSATFSDPDHSENEYRYLTIGLSFRHELVVVSHTERGPTIRIISARRATPRERKKHEREEKNRNR